MRVTFNYQSINNRGEYHVLLPIIIVSHFGILTADYSLPAQYAGQYALKRMLFDGNHKKTRTNFLHQLMAIIRARV